jgi:transcriptional regulator with XRE-family HTH domain
MNLDSRKKLADIIKKARGNDSLTAFGKRINVSYMAVSKWESGASMPDRENLEKIAVITGYTLEGLIEYLEGKKQRPSNIDSIISEIRNMEFRQLAVVDKAISDRFLAIAENAG